jgi:hypothetical protein
MFDYQLLYNPSPIKTKKITVHMVISDVEADEVPVTGAKRKAVTENLKDKAT